jgi:hypothetical protein
MMKCQTNAKPGMILYAILCKQCETHHPDWRYPCPDKCEGGKISIEPLGYKICPICQGRGYLNE